MTYTRLDVREWAVAGNDLLRRARKLLQSAPSDRIRQLASRIPATILSAENHIVLVFAGQYSAGKSTIIKVLTGRDDIAIGAGITTDNAKTYDWDGVTIVDTPGVHTSLRPDHDEITYRAIADADLLVFVVTNELFDSHLAQHFRRLAIERDKAHEMMLVVNKMRRCARGNTPESQAVIREDLTKVLTPFTPDSLRVTFIDADAALQSKSESEEVGNALWRKSGIEHFTQVLNAFVRENGLAGRYTTALYKLEQAIQEALTAEKSGDKDADALEELLLQRRRALFETRDSVPRAADAEIQHTVARVREEGRKAADLIHPSADPDDVNRNLLAAQARVKQYADALGPSIEAAISKHMKDLNERVSSIFNSELAKELFSRLVRRMEEIGFTTEAASRVKKAADLSSKLGEVLVRSSFNPQKTTFGGLFTLNQYSGTAAHDFVLDIGHFFGKSFMPWEAVKWTRAIANVGRVFAVAGTALTFIFQMKEDADAAQLEKDLRESRAAVRSGFNEAAHVIEMHFDSATRSCLASTLDAEIEVVDARINELRDLRQSRSDSFNNLIAILKETREMIRFLHAATREPDRKATAAAAS